MSDYHILSADQYGNRYTVAFHIPVPLADNQALYPYRTALIEFQGGSGAITSAVPFIEGTEETQMKAGEVFEVVESFNSNPLETLSQKRDKLDSRHGELVTQVQQDFQDRLGFWGYSRDIP